MLNSSIPSSISFKFADVGRAKSALRGYGVVLVPWLMGSMGYNRVLASLDAPRPERRARELGFQISGELDLAGADV
jgi:hypothetical protein